MSNSTVRLYDLLKAEYPGQVYLGQIAQSVDIQSTTGVILLETISEDASGNKDGAKRDKIVYNVHVIGLLQKTIDSLAKDIRDLVEPYNDEYIYLMEYTGTQRDRDDTGEVFRNILSFTCWNNGDGLNTPTGYWEYYALMDYLTGAITVLNQNELNYMPIAWTYENINAGESFVYTSEHNISPNDIEFFWLIPNNQGAVMQFDVDVDASTLVINVPQPDPLQDLQILIRVRKDVSGSFASTN